MDSPAAVPDDSAIGFSVEPKTDCPHALDRGHYPRRMEQIDVNAKCKKCGFAKENWFCLACASVFCGRYVNAHMAEHFRESGHAIALSFADLSFWCYLCDSYIVTKELQEHIYAAAHFSKFGSWPGEAPLDAAELEMTQKLMTQPISKPSAAVAAAPPATPEGQLRVAGLDEKLLQDKTVDRLLGCLYGNALGDAYGLATEFMNSKQISATYGKDVIPFPNFQRNGHNSRWEAGDWTDDTDQMILILETIVERQGAIDATAVKLFAQKLQTWMRKGFPELGDFAGMGLGSTVGAVLRTPTFLEDPHGTAQVVWERMNRNAAANGAVMRTSVCGCFQFNNLPAVIRNTKQFCKVTHYDERCVASCVAVTAAISLMLQGKHDTPNGPAVEPICKEALALATKELSGSPDEFAAHFAATELAQLKLDEPEAIGYTLKCMGAGFWALRSQKSFKETLHELIREGGDADTNGAVAGALLGCRIGYSQLPKDWLAALKHKAWLDAKVVALLRLMRVG